MIIPFPQLTPAIVRNPLVLSPDTKVLEAITSLINQRSQPVKSNCAVVVENGQIVGIVTKGDILVALAQSQTLDFLTISQVMSSPVVMLRESEFTGLESAINLFQTHSIDHLPIIDSENHLVGLLTSDSLSAVIQSYIMKDQKIAEKKTTLQLENSFQAAILDEINHISSPKQEQRKLQESELNYTSLAEIAPIGIFRTDTQGYCVYVNPRWCEIAGLTSEEAKGKGWEQVLHPDDDDEVSAQWYRSVEENRLFQLEYRFKRPNGEIRYVYGQSVALRDINQQIIGYLGTITDITEQKKTEYRLKEALRLAKLGNWELDVQNNIGYWSEEVFHIFGREPQPFSPSFDGFLELVHPDDRSKVVASYTQHLEKRIPHEVVHRVPMPDGRIKVVVERCETAYDAEGKPIHSLGTVQDITEYYKQETILKKLLAGTSNTLTQEFFSALVRHIAEALEVSYVIIAELIDERLHTFAFWGDEQLQKNIDVAICQTPCEYVIKDGFFYCSHSIQEQFPQNTHLAQMQAESYLGIVLTDKNSHPIGILCVLDVKPMDRETAEMIQQILQIFAGRASAELERKRSDEALQQLKATLEAQVEERTQQLQESQRFIQQITDQSPSILYLYDLQEQRNIYINQEVSRILGYSPTEIQEMGNLIISRLIHPQDLSRFNRYLEQLKQAQDHEILGVEYRFQDIKGQWRWFSGRDAVFSRDSQGRVKQVIGVAQDITERKQAEQTLYLQAQQEKLLREINQRIRQSLDLQTIFDTACQEILLLLQVDRVGIFRFDPESHYDDGEFIAEAMVAGLPSAIAIHVHDHCFGEKFSSLYAQGKFLAVDDINNSELMDCHREILSQFQIKAHLVLPLLCEEQLWGLLCVHQCYDTRHWKEAEIKLLQQITHQLTIAIQQASLYEQIRQKLRQQQAIAAIVQQVRQSLNIEEILNTITQDVRALFDCDRVIIFRLYSDGGSRIIEESVSTEFLPLKYCHWDDETWSQDILNLYWQGQPRIVPDVMNDIYTECLHEYSREGQIQSKIVAPILLDLKEKENHRWVASTNSHKLWGILVVHACREKRVWQNSEAQLLQQIANQLAIAIQQASLFEQLQVEIEDKQQKNAELDRATRLKDEFLANMSHELRTPLNAILGMTEGLQDEIFGQINERQRKSLKIIEQAGNHLLELINDILDVSKIESGQLELHCTSTEIIPLCQSSLAFVKQQAVKKRIQLDFNISSNILMLTLDERRIRQVIINLLNNAVKFTPEGGKVGLEVVQIGENTVRFAVKDTGIGIAAENIPKLFQPFMQIDSALNRQYTGTGLGLALVKRLVDLHGGEVSVTSELGVGSCFSVDLPLMESCSTDNFFDFQTPLTPEVEANSVNLKNAPLILLAEDNETNITTISNYLKAKKYKLILAKNGKEAISLAQSQQPDLILMDICLPGINGLEAIQQIRQLPDLKDIPIIAVTALALTGDRERCLEAGANEYLSKPLKLKELVALIQSLLE
ncbi:PAS domain-containing protein [Gloeothece verrucosa]|uniref:histidine kinase n=1 Tax=Gloeothece verrucosa (strain PCC 7822) TaxID=497965 RepID=E0U6T9_GLOV7|nr:PAS domain-containing protein [Gloeothece verrucosa]ADN15976.1 multi-sensor hybrid histidine kinase [Gloeothece verrucosa PCC 7822]